MKIYKVRETELSLNDPYNSKMQFNFTLFLTIKLS